MNLRTFPIRAKDWILILIGAIIGFAGVYAYARLRPRSSQHYYENARLVSLNDDVSQGRANAIVIAAQKVSPSVVSITVVQTKVVSASPFQSPFADDFFRDFFGDFFPERYYRQQVRSLGTGLIISPDGYIVTNEHVVSNATRINVTLPDSRQYEARVIAADAALDHALLKIDAADLPYAELGNSDGLMIGEWVVAFGNPFGFMLEDTRPTVTVGVVSALNRSIKSTQEERVYKKMIQTDAAINPGNSGGPLVNVLGEVIGLNTAIFTSGGGSEGIGFARPINDVKKFIDEARRHGRIRSPWIGIWVREIAQDPNASAAPRGPGLLVAAVDRGCAAHRAGIRKDDRVLSVNGRSVSRVDDWSSFVSTAYVGDKINITVARGKDTTSADFTIEELGEPGPASSAIYGIHVQDINRELSRAYNILYEQGVVVTKVDPESIGEALGIVPGDVVLMVGSARVYSSDDFRKAARDARNMRIVIDRRGRIIQLGSGI